MSAMSERNKRESSMEGIHGVYHETESGAVSTPTTRASGTDASAPPAAAAEWTRPSCFISLRRLAICWRAVSAIAAAG